MRDAQDLVFASPEPSFELVRVDGACVVSAVGELDLYAAAELERALARARAESRSVVLDLSLVTFVDSTALGKLLAFDRRLAGAGGSFALVVSGAEVARALELTRLDRILRALPSREEAVRAVTFSGLR